MANTQQWNLPAATDIADTDKFSGSKGPNIGDDKSFTWALIKSKINDFFASTFSGITTRLTNLENATKVNPTYVAPVFSVSSTVPAGDYEVGTVLDPILTGTLQVNDSGGQQGTGNVMGVSVNGATMFFVNTNPYELGPVPISTTGRNAKIGLKYLAGPVKNDSLGNPYPTGQIQAGTALSPLLSWNGRYAGWYGPIDEDDFSLVANLRTESAMSKFLDAVARGQNSQAFVLNTGASASNFLIALPNNAILVSVIDLDALNANITAQYVPVSLQSAASYKDAAGNNVPNQQIYGMSQSVPYTSNHRHQFIYSVPLAP